MKIESIPAFTTGKLINVIIETPLGSCFKYAYDPVMDVMKVKHQLPKGYFFDFNFGFIPNTRAEDGDPLDVIVYSSEHSPSGSLIECRVIGALIAEQKKDGKRVRNDRIISVPAGIKMYNSLKNARDIDKRVLEQYEHFFESYENYRGVSFKAVRWISSVQALTSIKRALKE